MASEVDICNYGLTMLGASTIINFAETSVEAKLCNQNYERLRDAELSEHTWKFALKRATLAPTTTTPDWDWSYQMLLPSDCLTVLESYNNVPYEVEGERALVTDESTLSIKYIARITDTTKFHPLFVESLAARIAMELAPKISNNPKIMKDLIDTRNGKLQSAKFINAIQNPVRAIDADDWINARI